MCFKNLPIEFDSAGNATLKPGVPIRTCTARRPLRLRFEDDPEKMRELLERNGHIRRSTSTP